MNKFFAIVGIWPNDLEIPLVICTTEAEATAIVAQFPKRDGELDYDFAERNAPYVDDNYEWTEEGKRLAELIFKDGRYYAGCGACYELQVREFEFGKPMVGWDLD